MKIIVFGTGKKYEQLKENLSQIEIVAFLDNNPEKENTLFEHKKVYHPARIPREVQFDAVLISSIYYPAMKSQLMELGIEEDTIYSFYQIGELYSSKLSISEMEIVERWERSPKRFLLIQHEGRAGGATVALLNLAIVLSKKYSVLVTFSTTGETTVSYEENHIPYICNMQMNCNTEIFERIISAADIILVNSIINNNVIEFLHRKGRNFYLWLHDHAQTYEWSDCRILKRCMDDKVSILAVSEKAVQVFFQYVAKMPYRLFPLAIQAPLKFQREKNLSAVSVIAVIGDLCMVKGQDILLDALRRMKYDGIVRFIGGRGVENSYSGKIIELCEEHSSYEYAGRIKNDQIQKLYENGEIDILICPSRFETMSIATIQAMSYGVPVIVSDMTGIADYIKDLEAVCIFESENSNELAERMECLIDDHEQRSFVAMKVRDLFERYFSLEQLEKRCEIFNV